MFAFELQFLKWLESMRTSFLTTLFEGLTIPSDWGNTKMAYLNNLQIVVEAYAVQVDGFADAATALKAAFTEFQ